MMSRFFSSIGLAIRGKHQWPKSVKIVEVGARDGLQNEKKLIDTAIKVELINRLNESGLNSIEVTSFVSPKWVPQMADSEEVFNLIEKKNGVDYPVLVPNIKGLEKAITCGAKEVAVFTTASETFSRKNTNCSIVEGMKRIEEVVKFANQKSVKVRGYLSTVVECPYEGLIDSRKVADLTAQLAEMGCYQISLGDTIGKSDPQSMDKLLETVLKSISAEKIALHCHDTYGMALVNIYVALGHSIATFDSSIGGLGGCPYAPGASGNVATEDLVYMLDKMGIITGINFESLIETSKFINSYLDRRPSRIVQALHNKK